MSAIYPTRDQEQRDSEQCIITPDTKGTVKMGFEVEVSVELLLVANREDLLELLVRKAAGSLKGQIDRIQIIK